MRSWELEVEVDGARAGSPCGDRKGSVRLVRTAESGVQGPSAVCVVHVVCRTVRLLTDPVITGPSDRTASALMLL